MKNFLFATLFIIMAAFTVKAQTYYGSIDRFTVNSGWNVTPGSSSTTINFTVKVVRELNATGSWNWKPFNMNFRVGLVLAPGTALIEYLSPVYNVNSLNFGAYDAYYEATFSFSVPSSKLLDDYHLVLFYNIPYPGSTTYNQFSSYYSKINNPPLVPQYAINISSVSKVETVLIGTDCGFQHAYGTSFNPNGHMENGVWKFAYDINYTKLNSSVNDADIYWEWVVSDYSNFPTTEKQFLVYPYAGNKYGPFNGEKKVFVEANDFLDEYDSKVTVRAKSRSTGAVYSKDYTFYFTAVNH